MTSKTWSKVCDRAELAIWDMAWDQNYEHVDPVIRMHIVSQVRSQISIQMGEVALQVKEHINEANS